MSSQQIQIDGSTQCERLVVAIAELRERGRLVLADAHAARNISIDLRGAIDNRSGPPPTEN